MVFIFILAAFKIAFQSLADDVTICPNGVVFVKQHVRKGIMSR